jgi:hypothetical protein
MRITSRTALRILLLVQLLFPICFAGCSQAQTL